MSRNTDKPTKVQQLLAVVYLVLFIAVVVIFPPTLLIAIFLTNHGGKWNRETESGEH